MSESNIADKGGPDEPEPGRLVKFFEGRFTILFIALIAMLLVAPYANAHEVGAWVSKLVFIFIMLATTRTLHKSGRHVVGFGIVVGVYVVVGATAPFVGSMTFHVFERGTGIAFCVGAIVAISLDVFDQRRPVTQDTILGAVSIYLLIAVLFGLAYRLLEMYDPGAFYHAHRIPNAHLEDFDTLYFSFVTLTTLGYGDIAPVSPYARTFAMLESVLGILYLATLVSRLIAAHQQAGRGSKAAPP